MYIKKNTIKFKDSQVWPSICHNYSKIPSSTCIFFRSVNSNRDFINESSMTQIFLCNIISEPSQCHNLLISFSIWTNTKNLFKINRNSNSLTCLHGLRSISLLWVIIGHRFMITTYSLIMNNFYLINVLYICVFYYI